MIIKKSKNKNNSEIEVQSMQTIQQVEEKNIVVKESHSFFDELESIEERQERRRGDRRRGYRRGEDRSLISRAQEEANAIKEKSAKDGFNQGIFQSQDEINNLRNAIAEFLNAKELAMNEVINDIAFIAIKVAEKIIKTEVACDETIVLNIVSEVLKTTGKNESRIIIKTHPSDKETVTENIPKLFPYGSQNVKIIVVDDAEVEWGSCIVETNNGIIDARFSTQLAILTQAFNLESMEEKR